jgi:hypothetical protein
MILEELTVEHTRTVINAWRTNFGFWGHNGDMYMEFPQILLDEVVSDLKEHGFYENRLGIGIKPNDDCKLHFRIGEDEHIEINFGLNLGRKTSHEYSPEVERAEEQFEREVTETGLRYYR